MYYAQFLQYTVYGPKQLIEACGDRSVVILDGRESVQTHHATAKRECKDRGYIAYQLFKGESFTRSSSTSGICFADTPPFGTKFNLFVRFNPRDSEQTEHYRNAGVCHGWRRADFVRMPTFLSSYFCHMVANGLAEMRPDELVYLRAYDMVDEPFEAYSNDPTPRMTCRYAVVRIVLNDTQHYRVVNLWTGYESSLYTLDEAREIARLAMAGEVLGSFQ